MIIFTSAYFFVKELDFEISNAIRIECSDSCMGVRIKWFLIFAEKFTFRYFDDFARISPVGCNGQCR